MEVVRDWMETPEILQFTFTVWPPARWAQRRWWGLGQAYGWTSSSAQGVGALGSRR